MENPFGDVILSDLHRLLRVKKAIFLVFFANQLILYKKPSKKNVAAHPMQTTPLW
jgi:hypothetical protein